MPNGDDGNPNRVFLCKRVFFVRTKKHQSGIYINLITQNRARRKTVQEASRQAGRAPKIMEMVGIPTMFLYERVFCSNKNTDRVFILL